MMRKIWDDEAWDDYLKWQEEDRKTLRRINKLILSIERDGVLGGIGNPEPLKYDYAGWFSRRIDKTNRLVYRIMDSQIEIIQCKEHYKE